MVTLTYEQEVEIAPGKWLTLTREARVFKKDLERPRKDPHNLSPADALKQILEMDSPVSGEQEGGSFSFNWNGKTAEWRGEGIPITLREHQGTLYVVTFNRPLGGLPWGFGFFSLNLDGTGFEAIEHQAFPRQVATQNMWLSPRDRFARVGADMVDKWEMLRTLDVESKVIRMSWTATLWYHLETGAAYEDMGAVDREFLRDYIARHKPIALPTLVRGEDMSPQDP